MLLTKHEQYRVVLEDFEGPLDLLLYLIKKDEIDINNIPISRITSQYLSYIELMRSLDMEIAGEYLYMAAILISIKTKSLLPRTSPVPEDMEELDVEALAELLKQYQKFKKAGEVLRVRFNREKLRYPANNFVAPVATQLEMPYELIDLMKLAWELLKKENRIVVAPEEQVNVAERMAQIESLISKHKAMSLMELFEGNGVTPLFFVATFFAILELMRMQKILVRQNKPFGMIWIYERKRIKNKGDAGTIQRADNIR